MEPDKRILFKDVTHFFPFIISENQNTIILLKSLAQKISDEFSIDIYHAKIFSLSGLSMKLFKKYFSDKKGKIIALNETSDTFIRKAYYGGRAEIFKSIAHNVHYYDVNSMYPFIMKTKPMPIGRPKYLKEGEIDLSVFFGFMSIELETPKGIYIPVLPVKDEDNHPKLGRIYPEGRIKGIYFSEEIKLAIQVGYKIIKIFDGYSFEKEIIFDDFVSSIYNMRIKETNLYLRECWKLMLNSLYGRYGVLFETKIKDQYDVHDNLIKKRFESVAISAAIASYTRIYLYTFIKSNNLEQHLVYWDTDAIMLTGEIAKSNIGKELGQFKYIGFLESLYCLAIKVYFYKLKANKEYTFKFRGINLDGCLLDGDKLSAFCLEEIPKSFNKLFYTYPTFVKKIDGITYTYYNKRKRKLSRSLGV